MTYAEPPGQASRQPPADSIWLQAMPAAFVLLWSTGFIGAKFGLPYAGPLTFLLLRFLCVSVILVATAALLRSPWPASPAAIGRIALVGLLIHGLYLGGVFVGIKQGIPAGIAALIVGTQPLLTALAARRYLGEHVRPRQWLGLVAGLAGVLLVVHDKLAVAAADLAGVGALLVALFGITAGTLYQKRHGGSMHLVTGSAIQFIAAALAYAPVVLLVETPTVVWTGSFVFALAWLTLVLSIGAISLFHLMIRRGRAARVASLFYLTPAVTALLAWLLFGETLGPPAIVGMVLSAAGVAMVTRG
jgi:drug/metabolite transporter (DMT)-like permease